MTDYEHQNQSEYKEDSWYQSNGREPGNENHSQGQEPQRVPDPEYGDSQQLPPNGQSPYDGQTPNNGQIPYGVPNQNNGQIPYGVPNQNNGQIPYGGPNQNNGQSPYGVPNQNNGQIPYGGPNQNNGQIPYGGPNQNNGQIPYGGPNQWNQVPYGNQPPTWNPCNVQSNGAGGSYHAPKQKNGFATAALVTGIFGLLTLCCCAFPLSIIMGVGAISFAVISKKGQPFAGFAIAGIILGVICIIGGVAEFIYVMAISSLMRDPEYAAMFNQIYEQMQQFQSGQ